MQEGSGGERNMFMPRKLGDARHNDTSPKPERCIKRQPIVYLHVIMQMVLLIIIQKVGFMG